MVEQLNMKVQIVSCPIVREESGLAMSSRNELLTAEQKRKAALISKYLFESLTFVSKKRPAEIKEFVVNGIGAEPALRLDYFEIVNGTTLQSIQEWTDSACVVGCIAVYCGSVRLIDNIVYKNAD
jgi:pantoate--beta-alanine ligase